MVIFLKVVIIIKMLSKYSAKIMQCKKVCGREIKSPAWKYWKCSSFADGGMQPAAPESAPSCIVARDCSLILWGKLSPCPPDMQLVHRQCHLSCELSHKEQIQMKNTHIRKRRLDFTHYCAVEQWLSGSQREWHKSKYHHSPIANTFIIFCSFPKCTLIFFFFSFIIFMVNVNGKVLFSTNLVD